jgi:hypothetical protein
LLRNKLTDFNCVKCNVNSTNLNEYELHVTSNVLGSFSDSFG